MSAAASSGAKALGGSSRPSSHKKFYNPYIRFTAWRLGVNPESVARYGDRGLFSSIFRIVGISATAGLVGVSIVAEMQMSQRAMDAADTMDRNRKAFYGKDFHSPKDAAVQANLDPRYGNERDTPMYVDKDSGLIMDGKGRLIAPAAHERPLMLSNIDIAPTTVDKMSALRDRVLTKEGNKW